jgi:hypothetical protein
LACGQVFEYSEKLIAKLPGPGLSKAILTLEDLLSRCSAGRSFFVEMKKQLAKILARG